jgi:lipoprotein NlpD
MPLPVFRPVVVTLTVRNPAANAAGPRTGNGPPDWRYRTALAALAIIVAGCASRTRAPVEERAPVPRATAPATGPAMPSPMPGTGSGSPQSSYTVKRGDTLFQIALDNGLDYRELAAWNGIDNPNVIHVGQVLRLAPPGDILPGSTASGVTTAPLRSVPPPVAEARPGAVASGPAPPRNVDNYKSGPKAVKERYSDSAVRDVTRGATAGAEVVASVPPAAAVVERVEAKPEAPRTAAPAATDGEDDDRLDWIWPAKGKVVAGYSDTANLKGIDIAGTSGEPVVASAAGKVVYAGSGLRGYGKLVIVKHNKTWLSAYAHNKDILVKEGQQVTRGQKIAEMGNTDADQVKLHFEIRRLGKPVDPSRYLPAG